MTLREQMLLQYNKLATKSKNILVTEVFDCTKQVEEESVTVLLYISLYYSLLMFHNCCNEMNMTEFLSFQFLCKYIAQNIQLL